VSERWPGRAEAEALLNEFTQNPRLLLHARAVAILMRAFATKAGEDPDRWEVVGLLHDFDYERNPTPETHLHAGLPILRKKGFAEELALAVGSHADYMGIPRDTPVRKALYAVDELSGFLVACALVRPSKKLAEVEVPSVLKRLKEKAFARSVDRECIVKGAEGLGVPLEEHIRFCLDALRPHAAELGV
jgi:putative nucleotidyltransferase with HDIG domain